MDSKPTEEPTDQIAEKPVDLQAAVKESKLEDMEFELDDQFLKIQETDVDHDQELLQI